MKSRHLTINGKMLKNTLIVISFIFLSSCGEESSNQATSDELIIGYWEETLNDITPTQPVNGGLYRGWIFHSDGSYEEFDDGVLFDSGSFKVSDNYIVATSSLGFTGRLEFEVSEKLLIIAPSDDDSEHFIRVKIN